jgi:AbrB family looped-hinge helix DNA binding protein
MTTAVLTSKGQVTIPAEVRRRMGLGTGDRIEFVELDDGGFSIRPAVDDVRSLKGLLRKPAKPVSVEDMDAAIRSRAAVRLGE